MGFTSSIGVPSPGYPKIQSRIIQPQHVGKIANVEPSDVGCRATAVFAGQFAGMSVKDFLPKAANELGVHSVQPCAWGDFWDVNTGATSTQYHDDQLALWESAKLLPPDTIEMHLGSQALTQHPADFAKRPLWWQNILPADVWGDGADGKQIKERARQHVINTIKAAAKAGFTKVVGFMGSPIWDLVYQFGPTTFKHPTTKAPIDLIEEGFSSAVDDMVPVLRACKENGVYYAIEVHPTELCFDYYTTLRFVEKLEQKHPDLAPWFGINFDPSHFVKQGIDPIAVLENLPPQLIKHIHIKGAVNHQVNFDGGRIVTARGNLKSNLNSHLGFGDPRRASDFAIPGEDDTVWEGPRGMFETLNRLRYPGFNEIEYEHASRLDEPAVRAAAKFVRAAQRPLGFGFEAAFSTKDATPTNPT